MDSAECSSKMLMREGCALQIIVAERGPLVFVFNFSPFNDYEGYKVCLRTTFKPIFLLCLPSLECHEQSMARQLQRGVGCHAGGHTGARQVQGNTDIR